MGYGEGSTHFGIKQIWISIGLASHIPALSLRKVRRERVGTSGPASPVAQPRTCVRGQGRASGEATSLLKRPRLADKAAPTRGHLLSPTSQGREWECASRASTELPTPKRQVSV